MSYRSVLEYLSFIGGIITMFCLLGEWLVTSYNHFKLNISLSNQLFRHMFATPSQPAPRSQRPDQVLDSRTLAIRHPKDQRIGILDYLQHQALSLPLLARLSSSHTAYLRYVQTAVGRRLDLRTIIVRGKTFKRASELLLGRD